MKTFKYIITILTITFNIILWSKSSNCEVYDLFESPTNVYLASKDKMDNKPSFYSSTDKFANWYIAQWQNPGVDLPAFKKIIESDATIAHKSDTLSASVQVLKSKEKVKFRLSQNGLELPCIFNSSVPWEFDLFVSANNNNNSVSIPSARLSDKVSNLDRLSDMSMLTHEIHVKLLNEWDLKSSRTCDVNQGNILTAVVLRNDSVKPAQIFYYQLAIYTKCGKGVKFNQCNNLKGKSFFWWNGENIINKRTNTIVMKQFGYRDTLASFGMDINTIKLLDKKIIINLLPRFKEIFKQGDFDLDSDISHWRVTGVYFGQNIWGNVGLASEWSDYRIYSQK